MSALNDAGHEFSVVTMDRDGLISRARNMCGMIAMDGGFDKLLFVDADIVWEPQDVLTLLNSDKKIIGGTYPYKGLPINLVFNALPEHQDLFSERKKSVYDYENFKKKYAEYNGEVEVYNLPTGFMLVDVSVFKRLTASRPQYTSIDPMDKEQKKITKIYDFFPIQLSKIPDSDCMTYETEDWGFCSTAKQAGFKIYLQTKCVVDHLGFHKFSIRGQG